MTDADLARLADEIDGLLEARIVLQRSKILAAAQKINPGFTDEDILQPHDHAALASDPAWNYEDGILGGLLAAQMAVRALLRRRGT